MPKFYRRLPSVAGQIAIDLVVRQSIDNLLNAGCTLQQARELLNREVDWRLHPGFIQRGRQI